ncbi:Uncharacterized protein TCM_024252 [Theobroma cacao]|uniref:Uncharacterized protein n=1 Tax=Theobroma cacao TaxID=3641 RepID=A0A061EWB2_THECC|nr:Uncharacterized protein TCM_024252 [Theobroma cacao]
MIVVKCPHRVALNAICIANLETTQPYPPIKEVDEELTRIGSIHFLNTFQVQLDKMKKELQQGLIYVDIVLNGKRPKLCSTWGLQAPSSPWERPKGVVSWLR